MECLALEACKEYTDDGERNDRMLILASLVLLAAGVYYWVQQRGTDQEQPAERRLTWSMWKMITGSSCC